MITQSLRAAFSLDDFQAEAAYAAFHRVVHANSAAGTASKQLLDCAAQALQVDAASHSVDTADVASAFPVVAQRRVLVDSLLIAACIEGQVNLGAERAIVSLARTLGVRSPWVKLLPALRRRRVFSVKAQLGRSAPDARRVLSRTWREEGLLGVWRALCFVLGVYRNAPLAARFRALRDLPVGTWGRTFSDHVVQHGFSFPGEKGGMPERMIHHDLMHVLGDFATDAAGECEIAGFYAGLTEGDAFAFVAIALATFQLGLSVSPAAVTPAHGAFDPRRVIAAFLRGRRVRIDVMGPWDYWALLPLPLAEARAAIGLGTSPHAERV